MKMFPIGTVREHGGKKYKKTADGWKYVRGSIIIEVVDKVTTDKKGRKKTKYKEKRIYTITQDIGDFLSADGKWGHEIKRLPAQQQKVLKHLVSFLNEKGVTVQRVQSPQANTIGAYYSPMEKLMFIDDQYDSFDVIIHEMGHALHHESRILHRSIKEAHPTLKKAVRFAHENLQYDMPKQLKKYLKEAAIKEETEDDTNKINYAVKAAMRQIGVNLYSRNGSREAGAILDTFAALTGGALGLGHQKDYWKRHTSRYAEIYTHCYCAYMFNWKGYKKLFPKMYAEIEKHFTDVK